MHKVGQIIKRKINNILLAMVIQSKIHQLIGSTFKCHLLRVSLCA